MEEALNNDILELLMHMILRLLKNFLQEKSARTLISAMAQAETYTSRIASLLNTGFRNVVPILDNKDELQQYKICKSSIQAGYQVAGKRNRFSFLYIAPGLQTRDVLEFYG